ncbi:hypothetical protein [Methyloversatilis sp.]|uniref:DUF7673 family protein n=1 Tax=Methyloversatilis sp. TaxID=2569862 RepID=UPI0027345ACA|nr:hypothetical protein [Methyloversatilis sp.]MDP3579112.1 hypothetical protein [Methyloversatilis sp.]
MEALAPLPPEQFMTSIEDPDAMQTVSMTVRRRDVPRLYQFMDLATIEEAEQLRKANMHTQIDSLAELVHIALSHCGTSGGRRVATLLASMYNGNRVKFDASDLRCMDVTLFEHCMNAIRLCTENNREPHQFFNNGGAAFEEIIRRWGLEKKRKGVRS